MPEVKNIFLKSKMNKDLDDRLIPKGEYRDGRNISINRSDDADVGALENILGNRLLTDFGLSDSCSLEIIGRHMDEANSRIFVFMTSYTDSSVNGLDNHTCDSHTAPLDIKCYIIVYDIINDTYNVLVSGFFLNFSKTHPIYGINIIENLLFWTDNRNQPRKINIKTALGNSSYYFLEEHISVAKYYPYQPISLIDSSVSTMQDVVSDLLPDGVTTNPHGPSGTGAGWDGDKEFLRDKFVRFSYRFKYDDDEYSLIAPFTQSCFVPEQDGYFIETTVHKDFQNAYKSTEVDFMRNKINQIKLMIPAPTNTVSFGGLPGMGTWQKAFEYFKIKELQVLYREAGNMSLRVVADITKDDFALAGAATHYEYTYKSEKPFKTLPESDVIRVNDLAPVRALAQETAGNRIIYGNFVNKHTPPLSLSFNANVGIKGGAVMRPGSVVNEDARIEYQNHTLKQNRTYTVGVVLSDLYGRQSSVIPASINGADTIFHDYKTSGWVPGVITDNDTWPGDTLKITFDQAIPTEITENGYPGLYDKSRTSTILNSKNPLGWFSYKIVVKQQEQDYYNVYFPGILDGYTNAPSAATLADPIGHITLHGDNINKIPKDLTNVGPNDLLFSSGEKEENVPPTFDSNSAQHVGNKLGFTDPIEQWSQVEWQQVHEFAGRANHEWMMSRRNSSVVLFDRVTNTNATETIQWYPYSVGSRVTSDTVITIGKLTDLSLATVATPIVQPEYYNAADNPLAARLKLSTDSTGNFPGTTSAAGKRPLLAISETEPVKSKIDLYWETTTAGDIFSLNDNIINNDNVSVQVWKDQGSFSYSVTAPTTNTSFNEINTTANVLKDFQAWNYNTAAILTATMELTSVTDGYGNDVTHKFVLNAGAGPSSYTLDMAAGETFLFHSDMNYNWYSPNITVIETATGHNSTLPIGPILLTNAAPSFTTPGAPISVSGAPGANLTTITCENGSASPILKTTQLTYVVMGGNSKYFNITPSGIAQGNAVLNSNLTTPPGFYSVQLQVTDGGGLTELSPIITVTIT